jgi:hypothetical protein
MIIENAAHVISSRAVVLAILTAVACGDAGDSHSGSTGGTANAGGAGGDSGAGGSGASYGGDAGGPARDPELDCLAKPYAMPPPAEVIGSAPALAWSSAIGNELPDGVDDVASAPGGDVLVALWRRSGDSSETVVQRMKPDGSVAWTHSLPTRRAARSVLASDAAGSAYVAGLASAPFELDGITIAPQASAGGDGFVYVLKLEADGGLAWFKALAYTASLELRAITVSPSGAIAIAGSFSGHLDLGSDELSVPTFMLDTLPAAFVVRLDAAGTLVSSRLLPTTGVHNQPLALPGAGGTNGLGRSVATDVAFCPDGGIVMAAAFQGAIDLGVTVLPNDDLPDAVVLKMDASGAPEWSRHIHSVMGEIIPGNAGGQAGFIPEGSVSPAAVAVNSEGRIAVTGQLRNRAYLDDRLLSARGEGFFTAVFEANGAIASAVTGGGTDVAFDGPATIVWDGWRLFQIAPDGSMPWIRQLGGTFLYTRPGRLLATGEGLLFAGTFFGRADLGGKTLDSAGCADGFVAFAP